MKPKPSVPMLILYAVTFGVCAVAWVRDAIVAGPASYRVAGAVLGLLYGALCVQSVGAIVVSGARKDGAP